MDLTPVFVVAIVFGSVVMIVKLATEHKIKTNLINKGLVDEKVKYLYNNRNQPLSNVKWGMILIGIGIALFVSEFTHFNDETIFGLMFLFAGIAFLIYYALASKQEKDNPQQN